MQRISGSRIQQAHEPGREIVQRLAEMGYQLEPGALEIICGYPGSKEELLRRIVSSADSSVAVIGTSQVSCLLPASVAPFPITSRRIPSVPPTPLEHSSWPSSSDLPASSAELECDI